MGHYIYAYAMPKGDHSRVIFSDSTYRTWPFYTVYSEWGEGVEQIKTPAPIHIDHDRKFSHTMSATLFLEIAKTYRDKMDEEDEADGPMHVTERMYTDDMTKWLQTTLRNGGSIDDMDVVLVSEI